MNNILHQILNAITIVTIVYGIIALIIFISLLLSPYDVKITNYSDNSVEIVHGVKKVIVCMFIAILWIIAIKQEK